MTGYENFDDCLPQVEYEQKQIVLLNAATRKITPQGSIFYVHKPRSQNHVQISPYRWINRAACEVYQEIILDRKSTHRFEPSYLRPTHELIIHLKKPGERPRVNRACSHWTTVWRLKWSESRRLNHPAPFPRELVWRCLQLCDLPAGSIVLDPYLGSGTTAICAVEMGHSFIGFEISRRYISMAMERINRARTERRLWDDALEDHNGKNPGKRRGKKPPDYRDIFAD